jgi:hypothetical protein
VCAMRPVDVVVDSPVLQEDLGFEQGVEALAVQGLVAETAVERLDPAVLPRSPGIDEDGVGEPAPVGHRVGDELRAVVEAHVGRSPIQNPWIKGEPGYRRR